MSDPKGAGTWRTVAQWVFYAGLGLLLLLIVTALLDLVLPARLASRVAYNSEAYLFAIVLASWIQIGVPRIPAESRVLLSLLHGAVWGFVGIALMQSDLPSRVVTLNEAAFALAVLIPYVSLRRPLPRWVLSVVPALVALTVWAVGWGPQSWVIDQAETFGFVVLAILTFDVFDRSLLQPGAPVKRSFRWAWYGFLILEPVVVSGLGMGVRTGGGATSLIYEYLGRIHESFVGVLLVALALHLATEYRTSLRSLVDDGSTEYVDGR